ncbi:heme-degrading monooxygenase HmoA [Peribacillus deserti]|uniref:Heme-degrading monooxygenase HmoA n=1 Tax=Peribacillus deserti TaxID=673318 RepID=A0ABS2QMQ9_9BACI|nr:antibiotic biosynthesis monooxygenase [Peribacillus deserti]MBM7694034.1 heme-degrading monooxygenase HmoA [Peribacillus deserti]
MNVFITAGTADYLSIIKKKHTQEHMILMNGMEDALLLHETEGKSVFSQPRKYEVVESAGELSEHGFVVMNNIPVTDEGRPIFEYRFKNRAGLIENEPGFIAIRVLRPLNSNTYVILTVWNKPEDFANWQNSQSFSKAHAKKEGAPADHAPQQTIFSGSSYVTKYSISEE